MWYVGQRIEFYSWPHFIQIAPEKRKAQHRLAAEVTEMVHTS